MVLELTVKLKVVIISQVFYRTETTSHGTPDNQELEVDFAFIETLTGSDIVETMDRRVLANQENNTQRF
jgi:hypothetical protein